MVRIKPERKALERCKAFSGRVGRFVGFVVGALGIYQIKIGRVLCCYC